MALKLIKCRESLQKFFKKYLNAIKRPIEVTWTVASFSGSICCPSKTVFEFGEYFFKRNSFVDTCCIEVMPLNNYDGLVGWIFTFQKGFFTQSGSKAPNSKAMQYRGIPLGSYDDGTRIDVGLVTIFTRCRWFDWMLDCRPWRMWMVEVVNPVIWTIATATIAVGVSPSSVRKLKKQNAWNRGPWCV